MTVLQPLAARYARWLGLPAARVNDTTDEDPETVLAMQLVLRLERTELPARTGLLEAAAAAAVAVCLDERSEPGGEWHDAVAAWVSSRIRKVARRARGAHWHAVQLLPGHTVSTRRDDVTSCSLEEGNSTSSAGGRPEPGGDDEASGRPQPGGDGEPHGRPEPGGDGEASGRTAFGAAQVRALVPGRVAALPKEVSRLQVAGTDLPADEPGPPPEGVPVLWLNPSVPMTVGKAAAQVGHATMIAAALLDATGQGGALDRWAACGYRAAVRTAAATVWRDLHPADDPLSAWRRRRVIAVRDAGFTEVAPGTITVLAQLPPL